MKINLETVEMTASENLTQLVNTKVKSLEKYYDRIVTANVTLKKTQDSKDTSEVGIRLEVPGDILFVDTQAESYEKALSETINGLVRQIKKYKEKISVY